jgi:hypothetical protein
MLYVAALNSPEMMKPFEAIIYGTTEPNVELGRKFFHLFIYINIVQHYFYAAEEGLISDRELETLAKPTLDLMAREKEMLEYLVKQRGYVKKFQDRFLQMMEDAEPVPLPSDIVLLGDTGKRTREPR